MFHHLPKSRYTFQAQSNVFIYTNPTISNESLPAIAPNFGLESNKTWRGLLDEIKALNAKSSQTKEHYKIVYAARHGEGHHNVAEAKYGTEQWDAHWSLLTGDGTLTWGPDPHLTSVGEGQAHEACAIWKSLLQSTNTDPAPLPTAFFSSPLIRSAKTLELTFQGIIPSFSSSSSSSTDEKNLKPKILECLRENFQDRHTCDQRSTKAIIAKEWQPKGWLIDDNMDEEDTLFASTYRETTETMTERVQDALSLIFDLAPNEDIINITSHSGTMQALCRAVKHDDFKVKTGGMLPLLIKATEI